MRSGPGIVLKVAGTDEPCVSGVMANARIDDGMSGMYGPRIDLVVESSGEGGHDHAVSRGFVATTKKAVVVVVEVGVHREALSECTTSRGPGVRNIRNAEMADGTKGVRTRGFAPDVLKAAAPQRALRIRLLTLVVLRRRILLIL